MGPEAFANASAPSERSTKRTSWAVASAMRPRALPTRPRPTTVTTRRGGATAPRGGGEDDARGAISRTPKRGDEASAAMVSRGGGGTPRGADCATWRDETPGIARPRRQMLTAAVALLVAPRRSSDWPCARSIFGSSLHPASNARSRTPPGIGLLRGARTRVRRRTAREASTHVALVAHTVSVAFELGRARACASGSFVVPAKFPSSSWISGAKSHAGAPAVVESRSAGSGARSSAR